MSATEHKEEKHPELPPSPLSLSLLPLSLIDDKVPVPVDIVSKYDTDTDADGEENENPIDSLLTVAQQSRHHHGARGKYGRHLDNEIREFIVRLRCDQEAKSNTIQQALADMGKTVNVKTIDRILAQQRKGKNDLLPVRRPRMAQYTAEEERYITELQDAHNKWT